MSESKTAQTERIVAGKPYFDRPDDRVCFIGSSHPKLDEVFDAYEMAKADLTMKTLFAKSDETFRKAEKSIIAAYAEAHPAVDANRIANIAHEAAMGNHKALSHPQLDQALMKEYEALLAQIAPEEFKKLQDASKEHLRIVAEITEVESAALKAMKPKELKKFPKKAVENFHNKADAIKQAISSAPETEKETPKDLLQRIFPMVEEHGFSGSIAETLGSKAWKEAPTKTGFRTAGVTAGAILVGHGLLKSKTKSEDGQEVSRGIGVRALETVGGAVLAIVSALAGGR